MSEEECERIVASSPLGNFLLRMDLTEVPDDVDPRTVDWALYVSDKGKAAKFPVVAVCEIRLLQKLFSVVAAV